MGRSEDGRWTGCLTLGPWWLFYSGAFGPTAEHRHHATQIVVCAEPVTVWFESGPVTANAIVIPADTLHRITDGPAQAAILFVDGDTRGGAVLPAGAVALAPPRLPADPTALKFAASVAAAEEILDALEVGSGIAGERSVEIGRALGFLDEDLAIAVATLASRVGLSPSEFSRRFTREVGLPFRSYRKWRRLLLAIEALALGGNLTVAAHRAGFADSAHLTRTFRAMFGIAPTDLTATSRWLGPD